MERVTAKLRHESKPSSDGSFKFAISLVVACLSVLYKIHDYAEYNAISPDFGPILIYFIALLIIPLLYIGSYVFFKAVSLEAKSHKNKEKLEEIATNYYLDAFRVLFVIVPSVVGYIIVDKIFSPISFFQYVFYMLMGFIVTLYTLLRISKFEVFKRLELLQPKSNIPFFISVGLLLTILIAPSMIFGHFTVEMDSTYSKQDKQIPLEISLTGTRSRGVFVDLYCTDSGSNIVHIDSIEMQSNSSIDGKVYQSTYLCGSKLGIGKYKAFINCSNLTEGYYQVSVISGKKYQDRFKEPSITDKYFHINERVNNSFYLIGN